MACITKKRDNVEDYVDDYLKKLAYLRTHSYNFHTIPDKNLWPNGNFETVLPPIRNRGVGRPRLSRRRGSNEPKKMQKSVGFRCGICKEVGHNSRTCINKSHPEVLWFTSTHEGTLTRRDATNYVSPQPLTQGAPQPSQ
ncbi:hypothetical protein Dsin_030360 [Dipteronia sinensis]|uniref:Uncharacterized protein n=1 Tax=Dipteronia sinensis TaxID=43782 RepID=A0AAD9ZKY6_9ROSI|nr:hypothetical protein Dsin_030360 [Dipteronia sinensis]